MWERICRGLEWIEKRWQLTIALCFIAMTLFCAANSLVIAWSLLRVDYQVLLGEDTARKVEVLTGMHNNLVKELARRKVIRYDTFSKKAK